MDKCALKKEVSKALENYQGLTLDTTGNLYSVHGDLDVLRDDGAVIDTFSVELIYPERYPFCYPQTKETGGRIPPIPDRHVYTNTKNLCLGTPEEEALNCINRINTRWFLDKILIPRLADEHRVEKGYDYTQEYAHGAEGRWKFWMNRFNTLKTVDVLMWLKRIATKDLPEGSKLCPCCNHQTFNNCHRDAFDKVRKAGRDEVSGWYRYLINNPYNAQVV